MKAIGFRTIRFVTVFILLFLLWTVCASPLDAQTPTPQPPARASSIAFLDDSPMVVDCAYLHAREGSLDVRVRNNAPTSQVISLELVGLVPTTGATNNRLESFLPESSKPITVSAATVRTLQLTFKISSTINISSTISSDQCISEDGDTLAAKSYTGKLVATSSNGDLIRRDFTLQVKDETKAAVALTLTDTVSAVTMTGTNFLPSPVLPLAIWIGVLFFVGAMLDLGYHYRIWRAKQEMHTSTGQDEDTRIGFWGMIPKRIYVFGVLGVIIFVSAVYWQVRIQQSQIEQQRIALVTIVPIIVPQESVSTEPSGAEPAATSESDSMAGVEPTPSPPQIKSAEAQTASASTPMGFLAGPNGQLVQVVYSDERQALTVEGVLRSGEYKGDVDFDPDDNDKGKLSITLNVRDGWGWAFLTVAIGVIVGYQVNRYFTQTRKLLKVRRSADELQVKIDDADKEFKETNSGKLFVNYTLSARARTWLALVDDELSKGDEADVDAAGKQVEQLKDYFAKFKRLRPRLATLEELESSTKSTIKNFKQNPLNINVEDIPLFRQSKEHLTGTRWTNLDDGDIETADGLKGCADDTEMYRTWLNAMDTVYKDLLLWRKEAEVITKSIQGSQDDLKPHHHTLTVQIELALFADKLEEFGMAEDKAQSAIAAMRAVKKLAAGATKLGSGTSPLVITIPSVQVAGSSGYYQQPGTTTPASVSQGAVDQRRLLAMNFRISEFQMTLVSFLLAVGSGLILLYFTTPTWGAPGDYLKAFLWGSVVSEGAKIVGNLVAGKPPV